MAKPKSIAQVVLKHSARTLSERNTSYGDVTVFTTTLAKLWSVILGRPVTSWQVLLCLDALKTARILVNPAHFDSWVDKVGYSALGAEVATAGAPEPGSEAP
jgi:hypothetical protein